MKTTVKQKTRFKQYYEANKEVIKARSHQWACSNIERTMLNSARARARDKGLDFDLTAEDIVLPDTCPYLGISLQRGGRADGCGYSIDRIDNTKGYVKGNIEIISLLANRMKNNASPDMLVKFAEEVLRRYA